MDRIECTESPDGDTYDGIPDRLHLLQQQTLRADFGWGVRRHCLHERRRGQMGLGLRGWRNDGSPRNRASRFKSPPGENRSFYEGNTGSRSITEVKLHQASIVLR